MTFTVSKQIALPLYTFYVITIRRTAGSAIYEQQDGCHYWRRHCLTFLRFSWPINCLFINLVCSRQGVVFVSKNGFDYLFEPILRE